MWLHLLVYFGREWFDVSESIEEKYKKPKKEAAIKKEELKDRKFPKWGEAK